MLVIALLHCRCSHPGNISDSVTLHTGAVNGVIVENDGKKLVIYGDPRDEIKKADMILFTHFRRDVIWAGKKLVKNGKQSITTLSTKDKLNVSRKLQKIIFLKSLILVLNNCLKI